MNWIRRRVRRSHFMLNEGLFGILRCVEGSGLRVSEETSKTIMLGMGLSGAVAAAYAIMKNEEAVPPEILVPEKPEDVKAIVKDNPKDVQEGVKESRSFWDRFKSMFVRDEGKKPAESQVEKGTKLAAPVDPEKLASSFRGKYDFARTVPGWKSLSSLGTYTQEEADTIVALKSKGIDTRAFAKMPDSIRDLIVQTARAYGVDEITALKVAQVESGGNPNAISATGAIGIYQFTGAAANDAGITNRFNAIENIQAGIRNLRRNSQSTDVEASAVNLYLQHQLGRTGARELIAAAKAGLKISELSKQLQTALKRNLNFGDSYTTAQDYIRGTQEFMDKKSEEVVSSLPAASPRTTTQRL